MVKRERWSPTLDEFMEHFKKGRLYEPHINDPPYKYWVEEERQKQREQGREKRDENAKDTGQ